MPKRTNHLVGLVLLMGVLGFAAVRGTAAGSHLGGVWPVGLASGLLVLVRRRQVPAALAAITAVAILDLALGGAPLDQVPPVAMAIAAESFVVLVVLEHRWGAGVRLQEDLDLARYLAASSAGAATGALLLAGISWASGQGDPAALALATFAGHLVSQLVLLAFFLLPAHRDATAAPRVEVAVRWGLTLAVLGLALLPSTATSLLFLVVPLVAWTALRAPMREALWHLVLVATATDVLHYGGHGPFRTIAAGDRPELASVPSHVFVLGCALVCIPFAMAVARQRRAAAEILTERERLRRIVGSASRTAIIETDTRGRITLFNPGAEDLLGYREAEVLGRTPDLFHSREEVARQARLLGLPHDLMRIALAGTRPGAGSRDWVFLRKDGSTRDASVQLSEIRDEGALIGFLCIAEDITARVRTQQALVKALATERRAVAQLTEVDRTKDAFVSSVSHELRTPITTIVGHLELLTDGAYGELTPTQLRALQRIDVSNQRLLELIDDLLTLSNVEALDLELRRRPIDLRDLARHSADMVLSELHDRRHELHLDLPEEPVIVLGDPCHLERMVLSLATNAVKFTPAGGRVTLRVLKGELAGVIEVEDTGVGFAESERSLLFNRFWRSSYAQGEAIKGSGLGLAIARSIAQVHGARITATSTPGAGSTFRVSFDESGQHAEFAVL